MEERLVYQWTAQGLTPRQVRLPAEIQLSLHINGQEWIALAASPQQLEALVIGFLYYANLIQSPADIAALHFSQGPCADVWLAHDPGPLPSRQLLTSGCGGGTVMGELYRPAAPLPPDSPLNPATLPAMMRTLQQQATLYHQTHGVHSSGLFTPEGALLLLAEDIGRHNTLDRLMGLALLQQVATAGLILLTTGRISSEMLSKAARMGTPIVASLTAVSSLAVTLAEEAGITVIGYLRGERWRLYTHPERLTAGPENKS